ncbi:MAG: serine/threonine protein kinase, partial [Nannocystaceae bacterium]|nr:serine/threonine protein kinase [Nannocystaceae bacterium]
MTPTTKHDPDCEPGESLTLGEMLGEGAVATVVMVTDASGHQFAGKILHDSHGQDAAARARFGQEAELARAIVHPNVVRMFGRRTVDRREVLVMELVRGADLATFIARHDHEPPDGKTVVQILLGIAKGLAAAHAAGVVHRDLKPSNVLLADREQTDNPDGHAPPIPKIADFGMARASSLAGVGVDAMAVLGTPDTMAPECLDPLAVDGRTDLYALGCIAFEMLTGAPPYAAATPFGVIEAHRTAPIPEVPSSVDASEGLRAVVRALLAKSPADRPQAAEAVAERLQALVDGQATALVGPMSEHGQCTGCRGPLLPGLAVCLACGMSVVILRDGNATVYVTGPGKVGDKLDAALRDRLHAWLRDNPAMGLSPAAAIDKRIPRLPFVVVSKVAPDAAANLVQALQTLGLAAQAMEGNAWTLPAIRNKTRSVAGRALAIASMSLVSMVGTVTQHPITLLFGVPLLLGVVGWTAARELGPAAK